MKPADGTGGQTTTLRDAPRPSAFGGGWSRFFQILWVMASMRFKELYRGTVLGYVWSLMRPLLLFGVLYVVFTYVIRFGQDIPYYAPLLLFNLMIFQFFVDATNASVRSLVANETIVRKTHFPRAAVPLSAVLTSVFTLGTNLIVVAGFFIAAGVPFQWTWLAVPFALVPLLVITASFAMLLAVLYVRYRDVLQIWGVATRALFYVTPVLYPAELVPDNLRIFLSMNPLAPTLVENRQLLFGADTPSMLELTGSLGIGIVFALTIAIIAVSLAAFIRMAPRTAE